MSCKVSVFEHVDFGGENMDITKSYRVSSDWLTDDEISSYSVASGENCNIVAYSDQDYKGKRFVMRGTSSWVGEDWNDDISSIQITEIPSAMPGKLDRVDTNSGCPGGTQVEKSAGKKYACAYSATNGRELETLSDNMGNNAELVGMYDRLVKQFCEQGHNMNPLTGTTERLCTPDYLGTERFEEMAAAYCKNHGHDQRWCNCYNIVNKRCGEMPNNPVCKNTVVSDSLRDDVALGPEGYDAIVKNRHCRIGVCPADVFLPKNKPECKPVSICGREWDLGETSVNTIVKHCVLEGDERSEEELKELLASFGPAPELGDWNVDKKPTKMESEAMAFGQFVVVSSLSLVCLAIVLFSRK